MPRETYRQVHIDRPLSNFSIAHFQDTGDYVAHKFFPTVPVQHASDMYTFYPSGYFNRIHDSQRAEEGIANTIGYKATTKHYVVGDDALRTFISDRKRANADDYRKLDLEATILVTNALLLADEQRFVDKFMSPGQWTTNFAGSATPSGASQFLHWSDAGSDPVRQMADIMREMLRVGKRKPNKAIMTLDVYNALKSHPDILDRMKYTGTMQNPAQVGMTAIAALFDLEQILVMQTVLNVAMEGIEDVNGFPPTTDIFMKEKTLLLGYVREGVGLMTPVAGVNFAHNSYIPVGVQGGPVVRRYRETPAKKGEYIEAEMSHTFEITAPDLGCLLTNVIA